LFAAPFFASAHCDGWDGPVVTEAREAIRAGDVDPILKWVLADREAEIISAFEKAKAAAKEGEAAREIAETWFLETLVRIHREGEGATFTGLKPAGQISRPIQLADQALANGSVESLAAHLGEAVERQILERFAEASKRKLTADENAEEGREFVEAYVNYIHF